MNVMCCIVGYKLIDRSEEPTAFIITVDGWKKSVCWIVGKFLRLHGFSSQKTVFLIAATIQRSSLITFMFYTSQSYIWKKFYFSETSQLQKGGYSSLYESESSGQAGKGECKHIWHKWGVFIFFLHVTWSAFWPFELF